ncbi:MAG: D-alanyl-D-alanine carboxypeptidase/D-alanyl-D-alanine-endopeptidase [Burkholderiaceae bacterium]|nr:D-alanyl-D-alanine carboxypeptidase/D-alanyl-D-alanine-endopeptidase [Burkholderiaceae bacterium]
MALAASPGAGAWAQAAAADAPLGAPIAAWLAEARVAPQQLGAIALPLDRGPALLAYGADEPLNPASTIKLVTTYAGLALLGPDYRWRTEARLRGVLREGVLHGDLVLRGGGDPKLVIEDLAEFVARMRAAGLEEIDGDLVLDDAIFDTGPRSVEDFDGEPSQPYNVRPFAALMNFKSARIVVRPGRGGAEIAFDPALAGVAVDNRVRLIGGPCRFGASGLRVRDGMRGDTPVVRVAGSYSRACGEQGVFAAMLDHRHFVHALFKAAWQAAGGRWAGGTRIERGASTGEPWLVWDSPRTLADVVHDINKFSNNVMTRQLMLQLAAESGLRPATTADGRSVIRGWLNAQGLPTRGLALDNGSGLSRDSRASAAQLARLLRHAAAGPFADLIRESLPVAGIDGTMKARLAGEPIAGRAWIKTGSLDGVRSIAGYVQAASGRRYAVAMIVNGPNAASSRALQDEFLRWVYAHG